MVQPTAEQSYGVIRIMAGTEAVGHFLPGIGSDFGPCFCLEKVRAEDASSVCLDGDKSSCKCNGFLRWQPCKHLDGLQARKVTGQL